MGRGRTLDFFLFMEKLMAKMYQVRENGGAWYIEKLSSNSKVAQSKVTHPSAFHYKIINFS
jgi:hypothetical protein